MKLRWRVSSIIAFAGVGALVWMMSCNEMQQNAHKQIQTAPPLDVQEQQEQEKDQPLATGGDLVLNFNTCVLVG